MFNADHLLEKWGPVLDHQDLSPIKDHWRKNVTAQILENQQNFLQEAPANNAPSSLTAGPGTGDVAGYNPILISLVRRAMPNLIAYDIAGVQPMTGPTGLVFALRSRYTSQGGDEALFDEANTSFAGTGTHVDNNGNPLSSATSAGVTGASIIRYGSSLTNGASDVVGQGVTTAAGESDISAQMAFSIERTTVTAKTRALKAEYTQELAQDLKALHGLDAETELANILSAEILAEINREVVRLININAKLGCQQADVTGEGTFDLANDADGRWHVERWKGMLFQLERESNTIAKETRRGKGNIAVMSSDVASALSMAGVLDHAPALNTNLNVDDTGNTFAGVLNGRIRVYIDPYFTADATNGYVTVGYKGSNEIDAGLFYCPYVPLQMVRAVDENNFQPKIAFKTRYGLINNPFVSTPTTDRSDPTGSAAVNKNQYYRIFRVLNLL
jgi:hypothetical protein